MSVIQAVWWALVGVVAAEAFIQLSRLRHATERNNRIVWTRQIAIADLVALGLRATIGAALSAVATASSQICSPGAAAIAGLAGPLLFTKLFEGLGNLVRSAPVDPTAIRYGHATQHPSYETSTSHPSALGTVGRQSVGGNEPEKASDGHR